MEVTVEVVVAKPCATVFAASSNTEAIADMITGIDSVEILQRPKTGSIGSVGTRWRETRTLYGKKATEEMWVTEWVENDYYVVRAKSHGTHYKSVIRTIPEVNDTTQLEMNFSGKPYTFMAKVMSKLMGPMMRGSIEKMLLADLNDIKAFCEKQS